MKVNSPLKNCLSCARYLRCKDPEKSVLHVCDRYTTGDSGSQDSMRRLFDAVELDVPETGLVLPNQSFGDSMFSGNLDNFDIYSLIDDAINSKSIVSPDLRLNDGDFKLANNFLEFCISDQGLKTKPFTAQALIGIKLFGEYCYKCSDVDYFDNYHVKDSLSKLQTKIALLNHGKCPHCKRTQHHYFSKNRLSIYSEIAVAAGQRSGKSAVVAMLAAYILHRMLKLQNPNEVYGLARSNVFHGTFVALTYAQAKDTLWDPFYGNLLESPWFQGYHALLHEHHERTGEELAKLNDTFVSYKHRRLVIYPAGPDKRTLRGRTRFLAGIDEIGWFDNSADTSKVKMSANEVYIALERSLLTVRAAAQNLWERGFTEIPTGYFLNVSSPSSVRDKVMELVRKAQGSRKILGLIRPTWEMNPNVTKKHLAEEFKADPVAAMRDYGAQPPLSSNAFLTSGLVTGVIGEKINGIVLQHKNKTSKKSGETMRYASISKVRRSNKPSCLALDAGYVNNSFAFAVGHLEDHKFPQIDIVGEIMPLPGMRLNFSRIYEEVIVPLVDARNVQLVAADRWNSIKILSDIEEEEEVETRQYSLKYADMRLFKDYIENKQLILPDPKRTLEEITKYSQSDYPSCFKDDPIGHFYLQLLTVQDTGSSVVKGDQLTDDMVRASMLCVRMLLDDDHAELWSSDRIEEAPQVDIQAMAVQRGYSGGGGSGVAANPNGSALGVRRSRQG